MTFHENEVYGYAASFEVSDPDILEDMGIEFEDGRWLERGETNVVVLGHLLAHEAFEEEVHVKNRIEVNDERYVVIGIVESVGNTQDDMTMYLSNDDLIEIAGVDEIMTIMAFTHSGIDVSEAAEKTQLKLNRARHDEDLRVMTSEDILERINQVLGILNLVLVGVAGISLLVGSVGIMNTMYTAVLERTKEIGIMKAIGAANNEIMMIFLIESAIFGILGGSIGALIGTLMAKSVEAAAGAFFFTFTVSPSPMIIGASILFAGIIGGVAGAFPAYRASKLNPTDALRYE